MNIKIICIGKIKENFLVDGIKEYSKRISKYCKLDIIEINDKKIPDNPNQAEIEQIKLQEANEILKHISSKDYTISLDLKGNFLTSEELAKKTSDIYINGYNTITYIIGGSLGLHKTVLEKCNYSISFSKMTFPHQLFRLILLEQIYRSFKINNNETYHK
ncbi:MAG: 23S rRNA (pseudouridine(1915)-N(3))-methyltransferase RlmH [Clostridiales bacterium]|nr:23S rRNA (pseudouridine(1915)-N(3))-methyltransferase RlmH [Clostridiales bacterium]